MLRAGACVLLAVLAAGCRSSSEPVATGSWANPVTAELPATRGAMAPYLSTSGDAVLATWLEPAPGDGQRLRVARWQGGRWSPPVSVFESDRIVANWSDVPVVARGGDGALVVTWAQRSGAGGETYDAMVARSTDDGATWRTLGALHADRTPAEHGFVSMVADDRGVRAFWLDGRDAERDGGATMLRAAHVGDAVSDEAVVDDRVCDCCATAAVATSDGPRVAYRDRSPAEVRDVRIAQPDEGTWPTSLAADDGWTIAGCPVNGPALAAVGRELVVAWYTAAASTPRVRVAFSHDSGTGFDPPIEIDATQDARMPIGRVGVALDADGTALVSWMTTVGERATVMVRRVAMDRRLGPPLAFPTAASAREAGMPRIARAGDGVLLAWTDPSAAPGIHAVRVAGSAIPAVTAASAAPAVGQAPAGPGAGAPAPVIEVTTTDGTPASLTALRGRVVLVNLSATWCAPCRAELPALTAIARRYADRGLTVIGLDVDRDRRRDEIAAFAARHGVGFPIWIDREDRAVRALGATTFPVSVLIDRDGTIRWRRDGAIPPDDAELRAALEAALGSPVAPSLTPARDAGAAR